MMRLESFRDLKSGALRVKGENFEVLIEVDGRVSTSGEVRINEQPPVDPDAASPRSAKPSRKRGSR